MADIKNIQDLRKRVLEAFSQLENDEIDIHKAACLAKMSETIVSGLKSEMQYAILTGQKPSIEFYGEGSGIPLDNLKSIKLP